MTQKEKLIEKFYRKPKNFSWNELVVLLSILGMNKTSVEKQQALEDGLLIKGEL